MKNIGQKAMKPREWGVKADMAYFDLMIKHMGGM